MRASVPSSSCLCVWTVGEGFLKKSWAVTLHWNKHCTQITVNPFTVTLHPKINTNRVLTMETDAVKLQQCLKSTMKVLFSIKVFIILHFSVNVSLKFCFNLIVALFIYYYRIYLNFKLAFYIFLLLFFILNLSSVAVYWFQFSSNFCLFQFTFSHLNLF